MKMLGMASYSPQEAKATSCFDAPKGKLPSLGYSNNSYKYKYPLYIKNTHQLVHDILGYFGL